MKTPILSTTSLLLLVTGGLLTAHSQTNTVSPESSTAPAAAGTTAPDDGVLARLAARRAADEGGAPASGVAAPVAPAPSAAPTPAASMAPVASAASGSTPPGFLQFQLITRRNIFDPNRRGYLPSGPVAPLPRQRLIQTFRFASASYKVGKGYTAFFTGYGVPPSGEVSLNDPINGFKVVDITLNSVTLAETNTTNRVILGDQWSLSRADGGAWSKQYAPATYTVYAAVAPAESQPEFQQQDTFAAQPFAPNPFGGRNFSFQQDDGSGTVDFTAGGGGRRGRNRGNGGGRGGGGNNNFGGGFNADDTATPAAPAAPADPAVLARLKAQHDAENK